VKLATRNSGKGDAKATWRRTAKMAVASRDVARLVYGSVSMERLRRPRVEERTADFLWGGDNGRKRKYGRAYETMLLAVWTAMVLYEI
jgi:hypothetical protein